MATEYTAGNGLDDEARREFNMERTLMNKALGMSPGDTEDNCRWAAFYLSGKLGINSVDGAIYNNRKPMAPRDYLKKMQEVWKARDISTLYDDEAKGYRAIDGEAPDALEQRYAYAMQHASNSVGNRLGTMASRAVARDRITADELEWLTDEERKEAGEINKRMDERPYDDFSPMARFIPATPEDAKAYAEKARKHGENEAERKRIEKETEPRRAELKTLAEKRRAVAAYEKKLSEQNAWQTVLAGKQLLSEEGQAIVDMAEAHKDDLVGAVGEKFRELQRKDPKEAATLAAIIHALQPSADDNTVAGDAMRAFGRMMFETPAGALKTVVNVVERQIVGGEEYQRRREAEAEWRRAFEPMQKEHDFWGNAVVGFAGTIPYMAYAALPGGTAAVALSAANDFERQIVDQGGDVSSQEFQFARIAVGFGYAAIEKAQVIHPFRSIENRAWAHLYGTMTESVMSFLKTAGHQGMRYLGELGEEGLQGAVEQGFVAWGLGKDVASAAAKGLVEEAWGAIGPFAPLMALEAGSAKAAYRRGGFNAADMARQKLILDGLKDRAATAMDAANYGKAYGAIAQTWASMGENAALRQNELMRRYGVTADEALSMDQALGKMWAAVNGDAEAERKFMGGAKVKSAAELLSEVFTDAKVESRENGSVVFSGKIGDTGNEVRFLIGKSDTVLDTEDRSQWESIVSAVNGSIDGDKSGKAAEALAGMADGAKRMTIPEWEHLTPEARRVIADFFGLSVRGGIKSRVQRIKVDTSAADGSTEESDIDTTAFYLVSGKIDLTQNALPQAVFHEAMHSMIGFAGQMARAGDENAQSVLSALAEAYPALSGRESLDEESIADAYRDYLTGKIPLVEVQKSAFDKFFEFVGKWLGMIDNTGERALTVANAQSAMNVFFNDVLTGNFSAIEDAGRLADVARARDARIQKERIERTEREAAAPTEAAGESARTADEKFGGAIVAAEDELVDENGETIPPDKVAEAAAQGKAIMKRSEYERRKAEGVGVGARETDEERRERIKREETVFEGTDEQGRARVKTPDGAMEIETRLAVVDRADLLTSDKEGYPQEYQDKISRDKGAGGAQIEKIGRAPNSGMLGASETSDLGAPIVWRDADGRLVVIAGNGRVLGLRAGDEKYNSTGNYDDFARRTGERYGIQVPEGMAHPTLVRVIETDLTRDQLVKFALASNKSTLQEKNDADNMRSDGLRIDAGMAAKISMAPDAGLMDPRNAEFVNAFLASANGGALTGADGQLNATGVRRLRDALLGALLVRHPAANEVITILQDPRNDLGIGNVVEGVKDAAIHLVALRGREEWADYDLSDDIADALNDYIDFKRSGYSDIEDYLGQGDFLRNRPSLTAAILRELFARRNSAQRVADILNAYAKTAMMQDNTGPALFDMGVTPRETVWKLAVEKADARDAARHSVESNMPSAAELAEAQRQYDEVVARYTNPDGTRKPGWMKAPNGKPTKLTERQWVQVRTPYFKEWFGDWEALAELPGASIEDAKGVFRALMTSNANIATADGTTLHFAAQASKAYSREAEKESSNRAAHWCAVRNIESLIGRSRFLYEEKPRNGSSDIDAYVKYGSMFTFGGERYLAKITSKRYTGRDAQNFYSVESVSVEKIADRGIHEAIGKQQSLDTDSVNRIRQILDSVKPENVSKVVDENGEPMVVFHGTTNEETRETWNPRTRTFDIEHSPFTVFRRRVDGVRNSGAFFNSSEDNAGGYGSRVYKVFLNLRNPLVVDANNSDYSHITHNGATRDTYEWAEWAERNGYDGLIIKNVRDGVDYGAMSSATADYVAFRPKQIKSATDNVGTFDAGNPDIRYSIESANQGEFDFLATIPEKTTKKYAKAKGLDANRKKKLADGLKQAKTFSDETRELYARIFSRGGTRAEWERAFASPEANRGQYPTVSRIIAEQFKRPEGFGAPVRGLQIHGAEDVAAMMMAVRSPYQEMMKAVYIDAERRILDARIVSIGTISSVGVHPRDIFGNIPEGTTGVILSHNHPSGVPTPSTRDKDLTDNIRRGAEALGLEVKDHVITDGERYYSFLDGREHTLPKEKQSHEAWETGPAGVGFKTSSDVATFVRRVRQDGKKPVVIGLDVKHRVEIVRILPEDALSQMTPENIRAVFGGISGVFSFVVYAPDEKWTRARTGMTPRAMQEVAETLGTPILDILYADEMDAIVSMASEGRIERRAAGGGLAADGSLSGQRPGTPWRYSVEATIADAERRVNDALRAAGEAMPQGRNKQSGVNYPDAGREIAATRFSIGAGRKAEYSRILAKHRPDLDAEQVVGEIDKLGDTKKEKIALHWIVRGGLQLPEDAYKVDDALSVAEKAKVDPFRYKSPDELLLAHKEFKPTARPIDPATVPELSDPRDEGDGIVSYLVQDDQQGQAAMRRIIDTHWGEDANPWCLLARNNNPDRRMVWDEEEHAYMARPGDQMGDAWEYWNHYNALPKRVAFKNGKLLAFMATEGYNENEDYTGEEFADRLPDEIRGKRLTEWYQWFNTDEGREEQATFAEWLANEHPEEYEDAASREEWWDRKDESHPDLEWAKGGARFSIGAFADGTRIAVIDDNAEIAKINLNDRDSLREFLRSKVGQQLLDGFFVGDELPDEYVFSKDAAGNNKRIRKAKAKLATALGDAAQVAGQRTEEDAVHKRRQSGKYYRRHFAFVVPSGFDGDYRGYTADLVSYFKDGAERLYDVVNIEDDNKISAGWALLPARTASDGASRIPTDNASILPQPAENVKENLPQSVADALPGDASQYSIVAQNPLGGLSRDSIVVAMAAQDKLRGLSRPPELYAELAAALHANIDPATIQAEADKLIAGNRERLSKTVEQDAAAATRETAAMFDRANFSRHVADLFSGSATFGSDIGGAATEGWHRILRDLMARAPGYDLDALRLDTGADLTKTLMEILPEVFAPSEKEGGGGEDEGGGNAPGEFVGPPTAETWAKWNESAIERRRRYSEIIARVKAELLARQAKIKEREEAKARRAEEARRNAEAENGNGDDAAAKAEREANREAGIDENDADETLDSIALPREVVEGFGVDLANADEFASFMRAWVCDWLARKNPGTTYADILDDPVALATYRRTMIAQLRDIANALLDPTEGKAAIMAERMISDIRDDAGADELERRTSDIIGFIQRNAIRQKRKSLIKETLDMIELMAVRGRKFDALERDMKRKILGEHEAYARYIAKVILMSDGAIQRETERLNAIIEGRRAKYGDAEAELGEALNWESDAEIHKAMEQLAALQQYGGLKNRMPSYIVAAKKQLEAWLGGEREAHERRWGEFQAACDEVAEAIAEGVRKGRGKYAPDKLGLKGKIYEDVVASVRQRLEDMLVGAGTAERREAIGRVMRLLSEGSQQRESLKHRYRRQFEAALVDAAKGTELDAKGLLRKLEEQIPEELNDLLDSEVADADGNPIHARQRVRMTWGQAMQLYASLMQTATYGENIVLHQRQGQVEAIRNAAHPAMLKLVSNLRTIYGGRREELSATVRQVTGMPIYNPDPLYMPAKMLAGQREGLDAKGYAWSPLSKSLTPRVKNRRDFDLSADLLATYQGRTHDAVEAISFGVRGIALRSMLTRKAVVEAMAQSVGKERTRRLIEQVTDTLTDGYAIDEQRGGIMGLVRATGTATTYAALSFNLVTALKQMQSVSAWAPMLDGGYLEIGRHVANFDREAARELMNSPGFIARYGASGFAEMMRAALDDTEGTLIARLFKLGMTAVQIGDFVPGIVVGQGVYKARWQALMRQNPGMAAEAAKEQAATETWALIEECQQTSRLENTPHMLRRWGVMGRQVSKFATAPLQQVAHEIHTFRMWREAMAAGNAATAEEYRRKFVNTLISNHVLMPAAFYAVATLFGMALGDEPPEDEEIFGDLLVQMVAGPWARLFFAGAVLENAVAGGARLTGLKPHAYPHADFPAAATVKRIMDKGFMTARDVAEADWRTVADDLLDEISIVNAPVRYATKGLRNWTGYDAAKHRSEARKARAGK